MIDKFETQFLRDALLQGLDLFVHEFNDFAGRHVDQMIVVSADFFVARTAVAKIVALKNAGVPQVGLMTDPVN